MNTGWQEEGRTASDLLPAEERMLLELLDDGQRLLLHDASEWFINPGDMPTVCTWLPTAAMKVELVDPDDFCPDALTLVDENITVKACRQN